MNKNGAILIFLLITIAIAAAIGMKLITSTSEEYTLVNDIKLQKQAYLYAVSATKAVSELIKNSNKNYICESDDWNNIPTIHVELGYVSIKVVPINEKINLNLITNKTFSKMIKNAVSSLYPDDLDIVNSTDKIIDWIDKNNTNSPNGIDGTPLQYKSMLLNVKNNQLSSMNELNIFLKASTVEKLKKHFTVLGDGKLNLNFSSKDTLSNYIPLLENYIDDIVDYRKGTCIKDVSEIKNIANIPDDVYIKIVPYISVKSTFFYVKIHVNLDGEDFYYHVVLKRNSYGCKVFYFFAGGAKDYF